MSRDGSLDRREQQVWPLCEYDDRTRGERLATALKVPSGEAVLRFA